MTESAGTCTARGHLVTSRASRYLIQICEHLQQIDETHEQRRHVGSVHAPAVMKVEWTNTYGLIEYESGQCELHATANELTLQLSARDATELARLQNLFTNRLRTIGRRDGIDVSW